MIEEYYAYLVAINNANRVIEEYMEGLDESIS